MAKFSILVFGDNFQLPVEGQAEPVRAFLVWRYVEASSASEAVGLAFDSVLGEPKLTGLEPNLRVEEIHEVRSFGDHKPPGSGFVLI